MTDNVKGGLGRLFKNSFTVDEANTVTISDAGITPNSAFLFRLKTVGGTPAAQPYVFVAPTTGSVGVRAASGDTSVYEYAII